jgi:hypothetical protein
MRNYKIFQEEKQFLNSRTTLHHELQEFFRKDYIDLQLRSFLSQWRNKQTQAYAASLFRFPEHKHLDTYTL